MREDDRLYETYLNGNLTEARQSMLKCVELAEKYPPGGRESCLYFNYNRLYVLEKRAGNEDLAYAYLIRARYFFLLQYELRGSTTQEAVRKSREFTDQRHFELVDKWDKDHHAGKPPHYVDQLGLKEPSK